MPTIAPAQPTASALPLALPDLYRINVHEYERIDDDYKHRTPVPSDVALLVEASESIFDPDDGAKLSAYATVNIPVYWIVNPVDGQVEFYTGPGPTDYRTCQDFKPGQDVPVVIDGHEVGRIPVADILPLSPTLNSRSGVPSCPKEK